MREITSPATVVQSKQSLWVLSCELRNKCGDFGSVSSVSRLTNMRIFEVLLHQT